jgi:hypothetical protein
MIAPLVPLAEHTAGVVVVKITGKPDEDEALTVIADCASVSLGRIPKVIVWEAFDTVNLTVLVELEPEKWASPVKVADTA